MRATFSILTPAPFLSILDLNGIQYTTIPNSIDTTGLFAPVSFGK